MPAGKVHVHHPSIFTEALEQIFSDCNKLLEKKSQSKQRRCVAVITFIFNCLLAAKVGFKCFYHAFRVFSDARFSSR